MRYALKVFYDGRNFYGSQVQPGKRTVEGELLRALDELGVGAVGFQAAGRTDRGVSALGNVYAVSTARQLRVRELNSHLPEDIRVLAIKEVHDDFKPRKEALERVYKYFLAVNDLDVRAMRRAANLFEGERSFHNFCKTSERSSLRRLRRIQLEKNGDFLAVTYFGDSFLWQMVRRITNALTMFGRGELTEEKLREYFELNCTAKVAPAPSEGLVLWDVRYTFSFEPDEYVIKRLTSDLLAEKVRVQKGLATIDAIIREFA